MDTTHEISKLFQYSPKRAIILKMFEVNMCNHASGFRIFCPTRWTICNETLAASLQITQNCYNYWMQL